jgi:hypothetical protein
MLRGFGLRGIFCVALAFLGIAVFGAIARLVVGRMRVGIGDLVDNFFWIDLTFRCFGVFLGQCSVLVDVVLNGITDRIDVIFDRCIRRKVIVLAAIVVGRLSIARWIIAISITGRLVISLISVGGIACRIGSRITVAGLSGVAVCAFTIESGFITRGGIGSVRRGRRGIFRIAIRLWSGIAAFIRCIFRSLGPVAIVFV